MHMHHRPRSLRLTTALLSVCTSALVTALASSALAQRPIARAGNVLYDIPAGWQQREQQGLTILTPAGAAIDHADAVMLIFPGVRLEGDFRAWFDQVVTRARANATVIDTGETQSSAADGYPVLTLRQVTQESGGGRVARLYVAAQPGDRAELLVFAATSADAWQREQARLAAFFKSVTFANLPLLSGTAPNAGRTPGRNTQSAPATPAAPARGGELAGLYYGTELRSQLNFRTNSYEYQTITHTFVFDATGRVARGMPSGGMTRFDWDSAQTAAPSGTGRYHRDGNVIAITWATGATMSVGYDPRADAISLGRVRLSRMVSPANYRLDGTYGTESFANLSLAAGGPQTSLSAWQSITFASDGRFMTDGGSGVATESRQGAGYARNASVGRGTYRISDFTMELVFDSGERQSYTFWVDADAASGPAPPWIGMNGRVWLRR